MSRESMNYRVQVCGWSRQCFDSEGNQIMTPQELEQAAQGETWPCPSGVCMPARHDLTGAPDYGAIQDQITTERLAVLCRGERHARQAEPVKHLGDGGSWITPAPVDHRSWLDILLGR